MWGQDTLFPECKKVKDPCYPTLKKLYICMYTDTPTSYTRPFPQSKGRPLLFAQVPTTVFYGRIIYKGHLFTTSLGQSC